MPNLEKSMIRTCLFVSIAFFVVSYMIGPLSNYKELGLTVSFIAAGFVALFAALTMMLVRRLEGKNLKARAIDGRFKIGILQGRPYRLVVLEGVIIGFILLLVGIFLQNVEVMIGGAVCWVVPVSAYLILGR
jgi:hypothetical protein